MSIDSDTVHVATRLVDAGSFALAAGATAARRRFGYALFYIVAAVETYAKLRYPAAAAARDWLLGAHPADVAKYSIQLKLLTLAAAIGALILVIILVRLRRAPAELALTLGTLGVLVVFTLETISYHFSDAVIYTMQGGLMLSGWLYAGPALVAAGGALALPPR